MVEQENPPPCIAERYISAGRSSNLRCETGEDSPMGDTAILIAAGWAPARIGAALMRLQTKPDRGTLAQVHAQIMMNAELWYIDRPVAVATAVLSHWLDRICPVCTGVRFEVAPGTPSLSSRPCKACKGTGEKRLPYGNEGKYLFEWLESCKVHATASIKKRLRNIK